MTSTMKKAQDIFGRIVAVFLTSALGIVSGAAILAPEISVWKSAMLAGFAAVADVVQRLAKASLDGSLTFAEINEAFTGKPSTKGDSK
jgi:hypothetical protein